MPGRYSEKVTKWIINFKQAGKSQNMFCVFNLHKLKTGFKETSGSRCHSFLFLFLFCVQAGTSY